MPRGLMRRGLAALAVTASALGALLIVSSQAALAADATQIQAGQAAYRAHCTLCHGVNLEGGAGPALTEPGLHNRYATALELYQFIQSSMPIDGVGPGGLSDAEYRAVTAFVLDERGVDYSGALSTATAANISLAPTPSPIPTAQPQPAPTPTTVPVPTPASSGNTPPAAPVIVEPAPPILIRELSPYVLALQTGPFVDADARDTHTATEFEIRDFTSDTRVWSATVTAWPLDQAILEQGTFQGPLAGRLGLEHKTIYAVRARHRDSSGDPSREWSAWSALRIFLTAQQGLVTPKSMRLRNIQPNSLRWETDDGFPVVLAPGNSLLITGSVDRLYEVRGASTRNVVRDFAPAARFQSTYFKFTSGRNVLEVQSSVISFLDGSGVRRSIWLPWMRLNPERFLIGAPSADGGFFYEPDNTPLGQSTAEPLLITKVRAPQSPWRAADGFRVELVADGLTLPVQIGAVPSPSSDPGAPIAYITELYGSVQALGSNGLIWTYATDVLDERPSQPPPRLDGQSGTSGIAVDARTGHVYVSTVYSAGDTLHNKVVRLESDDGGRTAARAIDVLRMDNEPSGPSHQIHGLLFGHDGKLYVAVGDAHVRGRGLDDRLFAGKLVRMNRDGTAPSDNPHFDPAQPDAPISYQWTKGMRNDFALAQRRDDDAIYTAENGPAIDRLLRLEAGENYGFDGHDASIVRRGIWFFGPPAVSPVGLAFAEGGVFPPDRQGNLYVGAHGFNFVEGTVDNGKEIWEFELDADGDVARPPAIFVKYVGDGFASITGVAYLPDGLYFLDFYNDHPPDNNPIAAGARLWRVVPDSG